MNNQEEIHKFLHDLSNKLLPVKLKLELTQEKYKIDDLKYLEERIDDLSIFIKNFQINLKKNTFHSSSPVNSPAITENHKTTELDAIKILLIDDNKDILFTMSNILKRKGYNVTTCDNSLVALNIASNHKNQFNIIITDELMPGMSGTELIEKLISTHPKLKFICWSGYFDEEYEDTQTIKYLQKPVSKDTLLNKLEELLGKNE